MSKKDLKTPTEQERLAELRSELDRISHPAARIYPLLIDSDPAGWQDMLVSIDKSGQDRPIFFNLEGVLLDGRNRWLACKLLNIDPKSETLDLTGATAVEFIKNANSTRRHDTAATRGVQRLKLLELQKADPKNFGPAPTQVQAAEEAGMSDAQLRVLQKLRDTHPEIAAEIDNNKLDPFAAKKLAKEPKAEQDKKLAAIRAAKDKKEAKKRLRAMGTTHGSTPKPRKTSRASSANGKGLHGSYAALFEELDQLPRLLDAHPMSPEDLDQLIIDLREALNLALQTRAAQKTSAQNAEVVPDDRETEPTAAPSEQAHGQEP